MKLTAQLKLTPSPAQADALTRTLGAANAACDAISRTAWETQTFRQFALHKLVYYGTRTDFGLSSQLTVRCITKVADAYKLDKKTLRTFAPLGSVAYDSRILTFDLAASTVAMWTLDGRQTIPFVCGARQRRLLATQQGESDLAYRDGQWYVFATCAVQTPTMQVPTGVLGVDLGVTNIAVDSDGEIHSGKAVKNMRYRHRSLRNKLQRKGTLGSRRRLRKLAGQERRFATWVNHTLSKKIVAKAEGTTRAISLEDLKGIRTRGTVRRSQRATLHSWAFFQLRAFIVYKAALVNVPYCSEAGSPVAPEQSPRL